MARHRIGQAVLLSALALALLVACGTGPSPTPAPLNLQAALDKYLSSLPDGWGQLTPTAMKDQLSASVFVFDVRETKEMADGGYVEGSVNIPIHTLMKNLDKLPAKDKPIIVTCGSGHRSAMAMAALQLLGYTNVKSLANGISAWRAANLPLAKGTPPEAKAGANPTVDKDLLAALDKYFSSLPNDWNLIAPASLEDLLATSNPFQLEVRETKEVAEAGFIAGATNIPIRTLMKNLDKLPPDKGAPIIAECGSGHRSAIAMMALGLLGYTNVRSLAGGFSAWTKAGLPASKP